MNALFILIQHLLPQHLLSRLAGRLAECRAAWFRRRFIRWFIARYQVDMSQALQEDPDQYENFNAFFTRALKPGLRPLPEDPLTVVSPADGAISAIGRITGETIFQAKGKAFSLAALLGGDAALAARFRDGHFATVYLSPRDYHRVHMPLGGRLEEMHYVPGKLFSVNQVTAENIDALFARNERAVCVFHTEHGPLAVILVGAMIVAGIETVFAGQVCPTPDGQPGRSDYRQQDPAIRLERGEELGRFKLGSTAIVLTGPGMLEWLPGLCSGTPLRMGQAIGRLKG